MDINCHRTVRMKAEHCPGLNRDWIALRFTDVHGRTSEMTVFFDPEVRHLAAEYAAAINAVGSAEEHEKEAA